MELRRPGWASSSEMNRSLPGSFDGNYLAVYIESCGPAPGSVPELVPACHIAVENPARGQTKVPQGKKHGHPTKTSRGGPISIARTPGTASISNETQAFARRQ